MAGFAGCVRHCGHTCICISGSHRRCVNNAAYDGTRDRALVLPVAVLLLAGLLPPGIKALLVYLEADERTARARGIY
jgi:hypothetical protein